MRRGNSIGTFFAHWAGKYARQEVLTHTKLIRSMIFVAAYGRRWHGRQQLRTACEILRSARKWLMG